MKKFIIFSILFALPLITMGVGCDKQITIETPTATATTTTVEKAATWKIYTNKELGFKISIPTDVSVDKVFNDKDNRLVIFKSVKENFEVRIIRDNLATLDTYYYLGFPITYKSTLGGQVANVYEAPQGYCDGPACSNSFIAYSTNRGNDFYSLVFKEVKTLNVTEKNIISGFEFIPAVQVSENQTVKVFFNNTKSDPALLDCSNVYPVNRSIKPTLAVGRACPRRTTKRYNSR